MIIIYKKSIIPIFLLIGLIMSSCKKESNSLPTDEEILGSIVRPQITDEYIYPVQPGTPEWAKLESHSEMLDAIQIPDSVLNAITTWGLVESCFKYPLYGDYSAFNNQPSYINDLVTTNSGFKELLSREDALLIVLYFYRHWDVNLFPNFLKRNFIELTIGCDAFLSKLNERQLLYLISVALDKRINQDEIYASSIPPYSFFVMANSMIHYGYKPFIDYCSLDKDPITNGNFFWRINSSCEKIEEYSRRLLNI
jgi:hypothetical protein